jgi:L-amino acid N-acyltransferase YncA
MIGHIRDGGPAIRDSVYVVSGPDERGVGTVLSGILIDRRTTQVWRQVLAATADSDNAGSTS